MKIVNRGFLCLRPTQLFCDWAKKHGEDFDFNEIDCPEGNVYLIEDDFWDIEPLEEKLFKRILTNEFLAITEDESVWPPIQLEIFQTFFHAEWGVSVYDTLKIGLENYED